MKYLWMLIFFGSLVANLGAFWLVKKLYVDANAIRLDPLQLAIYPNNEIPKKPGGKRIVFFGDSRALSWPTPEIKGFEFINRGIGQQTSEQIRLRWQDHVAPLQADLVVLQLCVNDLKTIPLFPERKHEIVEQCKANLQTIIQSAKQQGSSVLLTTIFPLGQVPLERKLFWSDEVAIAIQEINTFMLSLQEEQVHVLGTYQLLLGDDDQIRPEYSRDLLHLNAEGYTALNQALKKWLVTNKL